MARGPFRVAVYFDSASERRRALGTLRKLRPGEVEVFRGVAEGWADAPDVSGLIRSGLTVDVLERPPKTGAGREAKGLAPRRAEARHQRQLARLKALSAGQRPAEDAYRLRLRGPLSRARRERLLAAGGRLLSVAGPDQAVAWISAGRLVEITALPFVLGVERYDVEHTVTSDLLASVAAGAEGRRVQAFDVVLHRASDLPAVQAAIEARTGTSVLAASGLALRFKGPVDEAFLAMVAGLPAVRRLTPYRAAKLYVDLVRKLIGVAAVNSGQHPRWTGEGEIVAVFDSGIDKTHPDLADRIAAIDALPRATAEDVHGHGTHIAGIVAGTGTASGGKVKGMAPGVQLVSIGVVTDAGVPVLPPDLGEMLQRAVEAGAKVVNLSFGVPVGGAYDGGAVTLDRFCFEHPDVLVVVAAGNEGAQHDGGFTFKTVTSPGTAKNGLTVGACGSDRPDFPDVTWGTFRPSLFSDPPAKDEPVAGDPGLPAADSGRGPTDAGSVKPDVVAPGTFVMSARAAGAPASEFWQEVSEFGGHYAYLGGTSMAAPVVTGAAAVLRQFLREEMSQANPSAALLKAVLVASTVRLAPIREAESRFDFGYPDFDQGFGRVDLATVLPGTGASNKRRLEVVDVPTTAPEALESRAPEDSPRTAVRTYTATVEAGSEEPLRVALSWTDREGEGVQNNLQLDVRGPDALRAPGNAELRFEVDPLIDDPDLDGVVFDKRNTVELVAVPSPPAGEYSIRVLAANTPFPPQGYALCVVGELAGPLEIASPD
jgi:serine protease AprX